VDADDSYDFPIFFSLLTSPVFRPSLTKKNFKAGDELIMGCRLPVGGRNDFGRADLPWKNRWDRQSDDVISFGTVVLQMSRNEFHGRVCTAFTENGRFEKMELQTTGHGKFPHRK